MRRFLSRISVKWIMPPLLVLPVVVVATVLTLLAYTTGRRSADDLANQNMQQIHGRIEEHLTRLLDMPPAINELNKRMLSTGELSLTDVAKNRVPVFETLNIFQAVSSVVVSSETGPTMWVIRYPNETTYEYAVKASSDAKMQEYTLGADGRIDSDMITAYDWQPVVRPWYQAAIAADGPTWGDVYIWLRGGKAETLGVPYVEPLRDEAGNITGVINTELTLSDISHYLSQLRVGKTGKAYIIERDGNLVANSENFDCTKDELDRLPAAEAPDPWIREVSHDLASRLDTPITITEPQRFNIQIDGRPMRVEISPFKNRENLDWLIVTLVPDADFLADIEQNRTRSVWFGAGAVLLMLAVSVITVVVFMRPFLALVAHVRRVGEGHLDEKIDLNDNLEMAQLSSAINDMVGDLQDRLRLRHALSLAMDVQQSLLPTATPSARGIDVAARSQYCDETGGDYYDYLEMSGLEENSMVVALGDVMGHGVAAAMLMATARGMLRSHVRVQGSLGELLTHVNGLLVADTKGERFMTMLLLVIDAEAHTLRWASAGHDPPFIYDPDSDGFIDLGEHGGLPLGVMDGETYDEAALDGLRPGHVIVVGTDGLWESRNEAGEQFGKSRLQQTIRDMADQDADTIERKLYDTIKAFCGEQTIDDDVTYVVIKLTTPTAASGTTMIDKSATAAHTKHREHV